MLVCRQRRPAVFRSIAARHNGDSLQSDPLLRSALEQPLGATHACRACRPAIAVEKRCGAR